MKNHQQVATATHMDLVGTATSSKKCINEKTPANNFAGVFSYKEEDKINLRARLPSLQR